jgi:hypothetical protein
LIESDKNMTTKHTHAHGNPGATAAEEKTEQEFLAAHVGDADQQPTAQPSKEEGFSPPLPQQMNSTETAMLTAEEFRRIKLTA